MSGNLWMFSDKLDDEDIEILKHEFITYYQGADYYGLGLKVFTRLAHEAGAVYKIGKKVLIRRTIFDAYLRQLYLIDQNKATQPDGCNEAKMKQGTLIRNAESGRMDIRFGLNEFREGIPCGTRMDVLIDGDWVPTRIEMENDWILIGIKTQNIDRFHRVAEAVAAVRLAGIETCPFLLPELQMSAIRKIVPEEPSFYISKELKYFGDDNINKISFSRVTGALFYPGGCYAVYNSRDYLMIWNGRGEYKVRDHLTKIARMNADTDEVTSAILFGSDYGIAVETLRSLSNYRKPENRFDSIYDYLHFLPLDPFGIRLLKILTFPDWKENLLDLLFDPEDIAVDTGTFEYDALENGIYVISFLDSDIVRLNRFAGSTTGIEEKTAVICFPEQVAFVRKIVGPRVKIKTVTLDMVEDALADEGCDTYE